MKTKLTITHDGFHSLTSRNIVVEGSPGSSIELSPSQIKKLGRAACGMADCTCGESLLFACEIPEPWRPNSPVFITIPEEGTEIKVSGNYASRR